MVTEYLDFFKNLAVLHPSIQHDPAPVTLDSKPEKIRFGTFWEADIFAKTPPSGITAEGPCLTVHLLDGVLSDSSSHYDIRGKLSGGFVISERVTANDRAAEQAAYANCQEILFDFLVKLWKEATDFCGLGAIDMNSIQFFQVGPLWDNRFGWWCKFDYSHPLKLQDRPDVFE